MLRQRKNPDSFKAGVLSITVHAILLGALLVSFNWKTTHPVSIAEVELWDSLPAANMPKPPVPTAEPEPVVKDVPKPEPKPEPVVEAKPQLKPEPKTEPEIAIKQEAPKKLIKKDPPKDVAKPEKQKSPSLADIQKMVMDDPLPKPSVDPAIEKIKQDMLNDGVQSRESKSSAAKAGVVDEFKAKIQNKIRGNVNKTLCGDGNPELKFEIGLLPTGQLSGNPKLVKSSGNAACDDAVERAIMASDPLPVPTDTSLFSQFRNLKLTFRPND